MMIYSHRKKFPPKRSSTTLIELKILHSLLKESVHLQKHTEAKFPGGSHVSRVNLVKFKVKVNTYDIYYYFLSLTTTNSVFLFKIKITHSYKHSKNITLLLLPFFPQTFSTSNPITYIYIPPPSSNIFISSQTFISLIKHKIIHTRSSTHTRT